MGSLSLVVCSLALWLGTAVGDHVNIYPPPAPQDLFIQGVHQQLPDCAPELNEITQYSTVTTTRDVFTTQVVPEVLQRTLYKTNYVTETSNTVETVYTTILIRSNIRVVETSTKYATAYTAVPTTFTETSTRTQYDIRAGQATAIITSTVTEVDEQFVPVYVTQTVYGVNPVTQTTTSTITSRQYVAVTVSFTERTTVPVVITETQTLPVPAVTSTVVNYITQVVPFTQTVPSERVISHREIHTSTVTSFAQGLFPVTVTQTLCPLGGSVLDVVQTGPAVDVQLLLPGPSTFGTQPPAFGSFQRQGLTDAGITAAPTLFDAGAALPGPTSFDAAAPGVSPTLSDVAPAVQGPTSNPQNLIDALQFDAVASPPGATAAPIDAAPPAAGPTEQAPLDVNPRVIL